MQRFLGEDISSLPMNESARKFREAEIIREFEVGILMEAIGKVFG